MKHTRHLSGCLTALLLLGYACVHAQEMPELRTFQQMAGSRSALYRGLLADRQEAQANGNPYWSTSEFLPGDIVFEGRIYRDIPLNINALNQRVLVKSASDMVYAAVLSPGQVSSIDLEGHHFVGTGPEETEIPQGFYEVLGKGPSRVYKQVTKRLNSSTENMKGDPIGYYDPDYKTSVFSYYEIHRSYYFRDHDGHFSRIRNRNALIRKFPGSRKEIRKALRNTPLNEPGNDFDAFCISVLKIAEP